MKIFELEVTDSNGENKGMLTVKAKNHEIATGIAVKKGYRVMSVEEKHAHESAVNADAEFDRMRRAVFVGTVQAHLVLTGILVVLSIIVAALAQS